MYKPIWRKTAMATAMAGMLAAGPAQAEVINFSWRGAFTWLNPTGLPLSNSPATDYQFGVYANGDGSGGTYGAPYYPGNLGTGADCTSYAPACVTAYGWYGRRTPVSGSLSFDISTGAGVGTINPFFWLGDVPGSGAGTHVAHYMNFTFQMVDTEATLVGTLLLSWNGGAHSLSIVLDASGLFSQLGTINNPGPAMIDFMTNGPTTSISGVGALPTTEGLNFSSTKTPLYFPLGPSPIAAKTTNALGCEALPLATQVNAYTIVTNYANMSMCDTTVDDGIGGSPALSAAFANHSFVFDVTSVHIDGFTPVPATVPLPPAVWLFGSGLLGLMGAVRRKQKWHHKRTINNNLQDDTGGDHG